MVADNSYPLFKTMYEEAEKNKIHSYNWDNNKIETAYAKAICDYVDKHCMPAYDKHIQEDMHSRDEHGL